MKNPRSYLVIGILSAAGVLGVLLVFTYAYLVLQPYKGFSYIPQTGEIARVFIPGIEGQEILDEDVLLGIDGISFETFTRDRSRYPFDGWEAGKTIRLIIKRGDTVVSVAWDLPGWNLAENRARLFGTYILGFIFWLAGVLCWFFVRPGDLRRTLLTIFFFSNAIFIVLTSVASSHLFFSATLARSMTWLLIPIYFHLHWYFPQRLGALNPGVIIALYYVGFAMAVAEMFHTLPDVSPIVAMTLCFGSSIILLLVHAWRSPEQRGDIILMAISGIAYLAGSLLFFLLSEYLNITELASGGIVFLTLIPAVYLYVLMRKRLGGMEMRFSRLVTVITYALVLIILAGLGISLVNRMAPSEGFLISAFLILLPISLAGVFLYQPFQHWFEPRFLGIPIPPENLLMAYSARVTTSLTQRNLERLLREEIFPSLMVRQVALLRLWTPGEQDLPQRMEVVLLSGVVPDQLPDLENIPALVNQSHRQRYPEDFADELMICPWARLILPLRVERKLIGLALFGRRDPDDMYAHTEIQTLDALMSQIALAFINIEQSQLLRSFFRDNIERQEEERLTLSRELHDSLLAQMTLLAHSVNDRIAGPQFSIAYQQAVQKIRRLIGDLRPVMLQYGLFTAMQELVDDLVDQVETVSPGKIEIVLDVSSSQERYPSDVELHLYRIVQQACFNTLKHAGATRLVIRGKLESRRIALEIADNGRGFDMQAGMDLGALLERKHFGLVGMQERAALILARLEIYSTPGVGTSVRITWPEILDAEIQPETIQISAG